MTKIRSFEFSYSLKKKILLLNLVFGILVNLELVIQPLKLLQIFQVSISLSKILRNPEH